MGVTMWRVLGSIASLVLCATLTVGCKNVCQKAGQHYLDCWHQYCDAHHDDDRCESRLNNPVAQAMTQASSCPNQDRFQRILDATCDELTAVDGPGL